MGEPFDLGAAQKAAKEALTGGAYLNEQDKDAAVLHRRPFYIHDIRLVTRQFQGEDAQRWEFQVEFIDVELPEGEEPVMHTLAVGANAYRDGLCAQMKTFMDESGTSIGPFKLVRNGAVKGRPYDFEKWDREADINPQPVAPVPAAARPAGTFRPRPQ